MHSLRVEKQNYIEVPHLQQNVLVIVSYLQTYTKNNLNPWYKLLKKYEINILNNFVQYTYLKKKDVTIVITKAMH